jgi:branched-chain amino acid transport system substrate-binding protein
MRARKNKKIGAAAHDNTKHRYGRINMRRRDLLKYAGATALAAPFVRAARADTGTVKVGVVGAKTGPLAPGAAVTHFPPWRLWAHEVNAAGGLKLKDGQRKVELIEYDDRTQPPEAIKAIERLATIDKVDWIAGLYGTGFNIAAVPTFAKLSYPQIPVACVTELGPQLVKKYPLLFFGNGTLSHYANTTLGLLKKFHASGEIGNKVAMVNVADEYGIEISNISKTAFPAAGFEIVYNKSYPLGTQDYAPVIKAAAATNPDAFIAWSYPPDTFGLTEQAKIENFNVKFYFNGIGCAFPGFAGKFGAAAENVFGWGGVTDTPEVRAFYKQHKEVTGIDADFNGSPLYYANNQLLTQAIEGVGSLDREAIAQHIKSHTYQTLLGEYDMRNQLLNRLYTVGEWRNNWFAAVGGVNYPDSDYVPARLKTSWA